MLFFPANYTRTADQNVTSPASTQHTAHSIAQGNQLRTSTYWRYHTLAAPTHGPLIFAPFAIVHHFLRERSGGRQPPAERNPPMHYSLFDCVLRAFNHSKHTSRVILIMYSSTVYTCHLQYARAHSSHENSTSLHLLSTCHAVFSQRSRTQFQNTDPALRLRSHTWGTSFQALNYPHVLPGESSFIFVVDWVLIFPRNKPLLCSIELGLQGLFATAAGA